MAFQTVTDIYVMEGTSPYVALGLASLDVALESDSFVQIDSSDPFVVVNSSDPVLGPGVTVAGSLRQADVPFMISFDDGTSAGLDVVLTLTLYHFGQATGDVTTINLHVLDDDDPHRPIDIVLTGNSITEDAAPGTVVGTLSTTDPDNPNDSFTYLLADTSNFVIVGNKILVADNSHIDFETHPTESLQVVTTDAAGHSFVKDITINITDVKVDLDVVSGAQIQNVEENDAFFQVDLRLSEDSGNPVSIIGVSGDTDFFTLVNAPVAPSNGPFNFSLVFKPQDFETPLDADHNNIYDYTITASDDANNTTTRTFHFTVTDANEAPTAVAFTNTVTSIAEDASTAAPIKVADIAVTDDALGTNVLFLYGDDADSFDLVGTELFLKAGVTLDFESKSSYSVKVDVDDEFVGNSPDLTSDTFTLQVTNVSPETLDGSIDGDMLIGGSDADMIFGFVGNDILNGMGGNDTLAGGMGKDFLTGGLGADIFNFDLSAETKKGAANRDVIMDFNHLEGDHIDLHDIDAKSKTKAVDDHFKFIGAKPFHHKAGELHFIKKAGFLLVEGDMDGNGKADFQIEVHGITKLGALDFNL